MRELRRKIYDKGPIITVDLFMEDGERKALLFMANKFSLRTLVTAVDADEHLTLELTKKC